MNLLVILSENGRLVLELLLAASALTSSYVAYSTYKHKRSGEIATRSDVIELQARVSTKAEQKEMDRLDRAVHHRIDGIEKNTRADIDYIKKKTDDIYTLLIEMK